MGNLFADIVVPGTNGAGAAVDVARMGRIKTFTLTGQFAAVVTVEASLDGVTNAPLRSKVGQGKWSSEVACSWLRARTSAAQVSVPVVANLDVGGNDDGTDSASLAVPAGDGIGAPTDVSIFGTFNTVVVTGPFAGNVIVEISQDGAAYEPCIAFNGPGLQSKEIVAQFMRVRRTNVGGGGSGSPTVTVCAVRDGLSPSGHLFSDPDTSVAPPTVPLPAAPQLNDQFTVTDASGNAAANPITVDGNGNTINGEATAMIVVSYGSATFRWNGTEWNVI